MLKDFNRGSSKRKYHLRDITESLLKTLEEAIVRTRIVFVLPSL